MAGLSVQVSAAEVNTAIGTIARDVHVNLERVQAASRFFSQNTDAEIAGRFQMPEPDVVQLRLAVDALEALRRIYRGQDALPATRNFSRDVNPIIGLGFL